MKRFLAVIYFTISIIILTACSEPERVVEETYANNQPKSVSYYLGSGEKKVLVKKEQFYESGTKEFSGEFNKDGLREGRWEYYFDNGNLWSVGEYKNGEMEGIKEVYWPDGKIRYKGQFKNGEKTGKWTFYDKDGKVLKESENE